MGALSGDVARRSSPVCLTGYVLGLLVAAAPPSSDVASTAAFSPLVLPQHHVSRHGISEGRQLTSFEEEGERPATRDPTTVLPVPQARDVLVVRSLEW
jgi:hypothetical protein